MANNYNILAEHIVEKYIEQISGINLADRIVGIEPEKQVMVGMLAEGRMEKAFDGKYVENMERRFESVPSISLHFKVRDEGELYIYPKGLLFYTVKPELEEVREYILEKYSTIDHKDYQTIEELLELYEDKKEAIPRVYKKIDLSEIFTEGIHISVCELKNGRDNLDQEISAILNERIGKTIVSEIALMRAGTMAISDLKSEVAFRKICSQKDEKVMPHWKISLQVYVTRIEECVEVSFQLVNDTVVNEKQDFGYSPRIYNAGLAVRAENTQFLPVDIDYFKKSYKAREPIYAVAENAASKYDAENNTLITENIPVYYQKRLVTNDTYSEYSSFDKLIDDPIKNLNYILAKMKTDLMARNDEYQNVKSSLSEPAKNKYLDDLSDYKMEIDRFEAGIKQIELKDYVKRAFKSMNMTFRQEMPEGTPLRITGWRLFQLVFIVSLIPEMIRSEYPEDNSIKETDNVVANLLYFPTGGGKTEAFLGATVFDMFFDRYRGKEEGITSVLKYPLRLLAVQQLDRVLAVVMKANIVKSKDALINDTNNFSVGFFVGKNNTPNKITSIEPLSARAEGGMVSKTPILDSDQDTLNDYYRFIDTCPKCGKKCVNVRFNYEKWALEHVCDNNACGAKVLPIYIVDNEIYRFLPTILVSTVDKMAMSGTTNEFKMLFGQIKGRCSKHGFTCQKTCICGDSNCNGVVRANGLLKDPIPTLFIQDEMHLVKESLGTFDAHYESFINYYAKELVPEQQRKQIRYIGATATISMYQEHIQNLYHMDARRFPCEYPSVKTGVNFYSRIKEDDITRIILGYAPYGRSITNGVWESLYQMRRITYKLRESIDETLEILRKKGFTSNKDDLENMLYDYWIQLLYNNRKQDAMELENAFANQANNFLLEENIPLFIPKQMTSDVDFQDVRKTLFDIQANRKNLESTNLILATSTISHGVDEDAFNIMYFYGMPNANAEYIQAYSRTGRRYTGIVIDIIRLQRVRDRSYLKNFVVFHQNKDDLVESVPINRWAKNAIYSSLPGILAALIHQHYTIVTDVDSLYKTTQVQKLIEQGKININDAVEKIIGIYACDEKEKLSLSYEETIREEVTRILENIKNGVHSQDEFLSKGIGKYSHGKFEPMTSLRDTEETIEIRI